MAKELLLSAIKEILSIITLESPNLTELVYGIFDKNVEDTVGASKKDFCERMERLKWVKIGDRGESLITPEGEEVLEKIEAGEDLEDIFAKWEDRPGR